MINVLPQNISSGCKKRRTKKNDHQDETFGSLTQSLRDFDYFVLFVFLCFVFPSPKLLLVHAYSEPLPVAFMAQSWTDDALFVILVPSVFFFSRSLMKRKRTNYLALPLGVGRPFGLTTRSTELALLRAVILFCRSRFFFLSHSVGYAAGAILLTRNVLARQIHAMWWKLFGQQKACRELLSPAWQHGVTVAMALWKIYFARIKKKTKKTSKF